VSRLPLVEFLTAAKTQSPSRLLSIRPDKWWNIIKAADAEEMLGWVYMTISRLKLEGQLPAELLDYCKLYYGFCRERNIRLLQVAREVHELASELSVSCVLLKGAAVLALSNGEMLGVWAMRDIDILVPRQSTQIIFEALQSKGYWPLSPERAGSHHRAPLVHPELSIAVELHHDVGIQRTLLAPGEVLANATSVNQLVIPCVPHLILHNCFNSEIQDRAYELGVVPFRHLAQLDWLLEQHGPKQNSWNEYWTKSDKNALGNVARAHLQLARTYFNSRVPEVVEPNFVVRFHLARCRLQLRHPTLDHCFQFWSAVTPDLTAASLNYRFGYKKSRTIEILRHIGRRAMVHGMRLPSRALWVWRNTARK
jgi:hypothetical protein